MTLSLLSFILSLAASIPVASQDLGRGFFDHGAASPVSNHRGTVATVDGNGRNVVLLWLFDHRGGYALLMVDAETGKSKQFPIPFSLDTPYGDTPYSSILSSKNKFYTLFNNHFAEFDPVTRAFTFSKEAMPQMAMSMTEDDHGVIWAVTYPNSGVVSFNPNTREFKDYGYLYKQNWRQYPAFLATDNAGWVYFGLGSTASQIIAFDPVSGKAKPMLEESERKRGSAHVYRDLDGKVYGQPLRGSKGEDWYEFYKGNGRKIGKHDLLSPEPIITGSQELFHREFPDGKKIKVLDLLERKLVVEDPKTNTEKKVSFDYTSDGAIVMGVAASPDGTIAGGTTFPMRFFNYNPKTAKLVDKEAFGQFNALARQGDRFYFGDYPSGSLLEWDPSKPWVNTKREVKTNPLFLASSSLVTHRPHRILAYSDGKTIIMSGTPEYGYTGGGLLFWDREKKTQTVLQDSAVIVDQSTMSLVALPEGKLLGGTTTAPGTGGEKKAKEAELYLMDMTSKRLEWHKVLFPGVQGYSDMCLGSDGLVYGITDFKKLFVFDPVKNVVVHQEDLEASFGKTTSAQSPRIFVFGPKKEIYLLFVKGIVRIDPGSFKMTMVAESPVPINAGGDYLDGRIYFVSGSHLCSYKL
ncbi:MAG: hypothetical protein H7069_03900 [Phormidesmis sp. FL-bin-119]|nr:hypothetical protein [Pedobacter sp.]